MFPSTSLFDEIDCPLFRWGPCKRPYCVYNHGNDNSSGLMTSTDPKVTLANGASHTTEDNYACLEELERINKEIEAVRSEVEKEQKRLSLYQTSQTLTQTDNAGLRSEKYLRTTNNQAKDQNGNHLKYKKPVSSNSGCKYVVDRARPKTDLEYDPCSNFSADLLSSSSVDCKLKSTDKVDIEHCLKNDRTGKNFQHSSSHFDNSDDEGSLVIDIPPSNNQGKRRPKQKGKGTMIKPLQSLEENCAVNNGQTKPRQHKEKVSSDGVPSHEIKHIVSDQEKERTSAKPVITQEQESSEGELVIDVSPIEDEHKLSKQCGTKTKELLDSPKLCPISDVPAEDGKEANEGPLNKRVTIAKHSVKETKPFLEDLREEPVTEPMNFTNLKMEAFVTQKEQNVLDDISTCLDNLRSESERIKCIQDIKIFPVSSVYGDEDISSQSPASVGQNATFRAEPQIDCISSYTQKSEIVSSKILSQEQAHQQYFPMASSQSFPSSLHKVEEHGCPLSQSLAETSWPTIQKSPVNTFAQNIPAYVSEIDSRTLSAPSTSQLNLKTTVAFERFPTSDASFLVPCDMPLLPQTFASAAMTGSNNEAIVVDSSSDEELRYSDLDLSETDPMEECYRIFMEANQNEAPVVHCDPSAMGIKRKAKVHHEVGTKVPHDVRQRYVNLFVEEFLRSSVTVQDAFEKALAEEKIVYDRSINKLKYLSIAVNALKRLKNQNVLPAKAPSERDQHVSRGNVPLNTQALQGSGDLTLYEQLKEHVLSEDMLQVNNFPRKHQDKADFAIQYGDTKKGISDPTFSVDKSGKHTRREECNYHYGKVIENRVPGGVETRYSCCENAVGSPGCQVFNLHVHDAVSLRGFVSSLPQSSVGKTCPGVFAVDTQTCYTTQGLELARVTVVNSSLQVIFDSFVKPGNDVIDYNTRFSGISEDDVKGTSSSLRDVQAVLLSFINADTILIGHGLENDLASLRIIHNNVIDTSVVFPHRLGLPHKRELNSLTADYLRRIIQESVAGHDTREDATACMELMLWRVKEDSKVKRW
ncbi:hypothetical protein PO909_015369 [Leuciscus waleckii]